MFLCFTEHFFCSYFAPVRDPTSDHVCHHSGDTFETTLVRVAVTRVQFESRGYHTRGRVSRHCQVKTRAICPIPSRVSLRGGVGQMARVLN